MSNYIHPQFVEEKSTQKFSDLRNRVSLVNEPSKYNYLGVIIERAINALKDTFSPEYIELIDIYKIFLQNFRDINEGAEWKSALTVKISDL